MGELKNKVAIITGAASGIGRAAACLFAAQGAKVIASDVSETVYDLEKLSDGVIFPVQADASSEKDVDILVELAESKFGNLHFFFANAGILGSVDGIFDQTVSEWERVLRVNLIGPFLAAKIAGKRLALNEEGGSIIFTSSVAGLRSGRAVRPIQPQRQD